MKMIKRLDCTISSRSKQKKDNDTKVGNASNQNVGTKLPTLIQKVQILNKQPSQRDPNKVLIVTEENN